MGPIAWVSESAPESIDCGGWRAGLLAQFRAVRKCAEIDPPGSRGVSYGLVGLKASRGREPYPPLVEPYDS